MDKLIPKAKAVMGFRGRIIVENCPYCGKEHIHGGPGGFRESHCLRGQYELDFKGESYERRRIDVKLLRENRKLREAIESALKKLETRFGTNISYKQIFDETENILRKALEGSHEDD